MDIEETSDAEEKTLSSKRKWTPDRDDGPSIDTDGKPEISPRTNNDAAIAVGMGSNKKLRTSHLGVGELSPFDGKTGFPDSKLKLVDLPSEILQHIFSFVDPISLGRVLRVKKQFHTLLHPGRPLRPASTSSGHLSLHDQNEVWASSRRIFIPRFPRPMDTMSERDSFQLVWSRRCNFCTKKAVVEPVDSVSPWDAGPGMEGVRAIWPFHVRACGSCLEPRLIKETDLLFSKSSFLMPGLPFAFFTPSLNYVTAWAFRQSQKPPELQITKCYFRPQVEDLEKQFQEARDLGLAAAEEWCKGLEATGNKRMADATRFEQFEFHGSIHARMEVISNHPVTSQPDPQESESRQAPYLSQFHFSNGSSDMLEKSTHTLETSSPSLLYYSLPSMPLNNVAPAPGQSANPPLPSSQASTANASAQSTMTGLSALPAPPTTLGWQSSKPRVEKTYRDVVQMKADRRAEIERRCLLLYPPIKPSTLTYMEAFNAAIHIPMPLNDNAWELLKTRIVLQRAEAEKKENDHLISIRTSEMQVEDRQKYEDQRKTDQEPADHTWSEIQKPLRDKIKQYADEYIKTYWAEGRGVSKATSGKFAVDVLQYVKKRFDEAIIQEDAILAAQGLTLPDDPSITASRKLKLEDMKWIFDEFVKPHTEKHTRDLFLCSACDGNQKHFSFDAVIQHYAAKHTYTLSHGNAVVWWKADWPTEPIFDLNPDKIFSRDQERHVAYSPAYAVSPAYATSHTYTPSPALTFAQPYTPFSYATSPAHVPRPSNWISNVPPGQPNGIYHVQSDELVTQAKQVWDGTELIRDLTSSVRLYVIIQQVAMRFSQKFTNEPTLSLFTDCIENKVLLKPIKDLHDLQCKACTTHLASSFMAPREYEDHRYSLPDLLKHFQKSHIEFDPSSPQSAFGRTVRQSSIGTPRLDWKFDMVLLPGANVIRALMYSPGIDQTKLEIIARVFPRVFPQPIPRIEHVPHAPPQQVSTDRLEPSFSNSIDVRNMINVRDHQPSPIITISPALKPAADNEYDPHRPAPTLPPRRVVRGRYMRPLSPPESSHQSAIYYDAEYIPQSRDSRVIIETDDISHHATRYHMPDSLGLRHEPYFRHGHSTDSDTRDLQHPASLRSEISTGDRPASPPSLPHLPSPSRVDRTPMSLSIPDQEVLNSNRSNMSAAEHFLNTFGDIESDATGTASSAIVPKYRNDARIEPNNNYLEPRESVGRVTPPRTWHHDMEHSASASGSRGPRSRSPHSTARRRDNISPLPGAVLRERTSRSSLGRPEKDLDFLPLDEDRMSMDREVVFERQRRHRPPPIEYDRSGLPIPVTEARSRYVYDDESYYDRSIPIGRQEIRQLSPPLPDLHHHRFSDRPVRLVGVRTSGEGRYIDERRYFDEQYEPIEYIRVGPTRFHPHNNRYYVQRPVEDFSNEYVGVDRRGEQGIIYDAERQIYTRSPPTRETRYEPSDEGEHYDRP